MIKLLALLAITCTLQAQQVQTQPATDTRARTALPVEDQLKISRAQTKYALTQAQAIDAQAKLKELSASLESQQSVINQIQIEIKTKHKCVDLDFSKEDVQCVAAK